mmetsp:Transcript_106317/g.300804  ORF Transcript_106317/g.300804 Transcript_106317/m.300804 type:complete len:365 (+) Transcript_106317:88-1182(+)
MASAMKVKLKKNVANEIRRLNEEGSLSETLRLGAVAEALSLLEEPQALSVLKGLTDGSEGKIDDPNVWVCEQAMAIVEVGGEEDDVEWEAENVAPATDDGKGKGKGKEKGKGKDGKGKDVKGKKGKIKGKGKGGKGMGNNRITGKYINDDKTDSTVKACIKELNASGLLAEPLEAETVTEVREVGPVDAFQILDQLERRASNLWNPNKWCKEEVARRWAAWEFEEKQGKAAVVAALAAVPLTVSQQKIRKKCHWINNAFELENPLKYHHLRQSFDAVDEGTALKIIGELSELMSGEEPPANPSDWIKKACEEASQASKKRKDKKSKKEKKEEAEDWDEWQEEEEAPPAKMAKGTTQKVEDEDDW